MLVRFTSSTAGELLMFAEAASALFAIVGKEGTARGVFTLEQLPEAVARLRAALVFAGTPGEGDDAGASEDSEEEAPPVGLAQRAFPFVELLERTLQDEGYVLWEAAQPF